MSTDGDLRVLQVAGLCGPGAIAGGVWSVVQTQTELMAGRCTSVSLIGGWLGAPPLEEGRKFIKLRRPFPGAGLRGLVGLGAKAWMRGHVAGRNVVHIHLARDFITTQALRHASRRGVPIVVQSHGMITAPNKISTRLFDLFFRSWFLQYPSLWLALSDAEKQDLVDFGVPANKIAIIPNTVVGVTESWHLPPTELFVFVSRLHERKQPEVFVRAAMMLLESGRNSSFAVVGPDQGERAKLEHLIQKSGYGEKIRITGPIGSKEVRSLLASCTALVLPSRDEIVPMVILEAAAIGAPIILTSDCHLAKSFKDADAALVIQPTTEATATAMMELGAKPDRALQLGDNAKRHFQECWSPAKLSALLIDSYRSVV